MAAAADGLSVDAHTAAAGYLHSVPPQLLAVGPSAAPYAAAYLAAAAAAARSASPPASAAAMTGAQAAQQAAAQAPPLPPPGPLLALAATAISAPPAASALAPDADLRFTLMEALHQAARRDRYRRAAHRAARAACVEAAARLERARWAALSDAERAAVVQHHAAARDEMDKARREEAERAADAGGLTLAERKAGCAALAALITAGGAAAFYHRASLKAAWARHLAGERATLQAAYRAAGGAAAAIGATRLRASMRQAAAYAREWATMAAEDGAARELRAGAASAAQRAADLEAAAFAGFSPFFAEGEYPVEAEEERLFSAAGARGSVTRAGSRLGTRLGSRAATRAGRSQLLPALSLKRGATAAGSTTTGSVSSAGGASARGEWTPAQRAATSPAPSHTPTPSPSPAPEVSVPTFSLRRLSLGYRVAAGLPTPGGFGSGVADRTGTAAATVAGGGRRTAAASLVHVVGLDDDGDGADGGERSGSRLAWTAGPAMMGRYGAALPPRSGWVGGTPRPSTASTSSSAASSCSCSQCEECVAAPQMRQSAPQAPPAPGAVTSKPSPGRPARGGGGGGKLRLAVLGARQPLHASASLPALAPRHAATAAAGGRRQPPQPLQRQPLASRSALLELTAGGPLPAHPSSSPSPYRQHALSSSTTSLLALQSAGAVGASFLLRGYQRAVAVAAAAATDAGGLAGGSGLGGAPGLAPSASAPALRKVDGMPISRAGSVGGWARTGSSRSLLAWAEAPADTGAEASVAQTASGPFSTEAAGHGSISASSGPLGVH
jgi:predicted Fe-S protein YdhL (DUF1289 family)